MKRGRGVLYRSPSILIFNAGFRLKAVLSYRELQWACSENAKNRDRHSESLKNHLRNEKLPDFALFLASLSVICYTFVVTFKLGTY